MPPIDNMEEFLKNQVRSNGTVALTAALMAALAQRFSCSAQLGLLFPATVS